MSNIALALLVFIGTSSFLSKVEHTIEEIRVVSHCSVNMIFAHIFTNSGEQLKYFNWGIIFLFLLCIELVYTYCKAKEAVSMEEAITKDVGTEDDST